MDRLRKEKSVNVSAWLRQLVQQGLEQVFQDDAAVATEGPEEPPVRVADVHENDQPPAPGVATEATQTDSHPTAAEVAETPQHSSDTMPSVATEGLGQENPEQPLATQTDSHPTAAEVAETPQHSPDTMPSVATEGLGQEDPEQPLATQTDSHPTAAEQHDPNTMPSVAAEDTAQMTPIPGWKPRKLNSGEWGAALEGEMVAELPDDEQLHGILIVVTDKRGESWTTTLTEVVDRTDNTIVVKNSGRPRS